MWHYQEELLVLRCLGMPQTEPVLANKSDDPWKQVSYLASILDCHDLALDELSRVDSGEHEPQVQRVERTLCILGCKISHLWLYHRPR